MGGRRALKMIALAFCDGFSTRTFSFLRFESYELCGIGIIEEETRMETGGRRSEAFIFLHFIFSFLFFKKKFALFL